MEASEIDYFGDMRQFDFSINGEPLDVYEVNARESIFSCFELEVTVPVGSMRKLEDYIGKEALFTMIGRRKDRFFHGLVSEFTWQEEKGRYYMYKAKVVPLFWKLNLISDVRIFQNKTTKEIVEQVLKESGILSTKYEFRVRGKCCSREYCVQYRETNMGFISRILAEEGMFYYFEFTESGHLLVFGDHPGCHKNIAGDKEVVFSPPGQLRNQIEHVTAFDYSTRVTPGKVALNDYRFDKPSYAAYAEKKGKLYRDLELYDYPGFIKDDTTGNHFADVAFDRAVWDQNTGYGKSVCRRFSPGHTFTLADHFVKELNRQYILTEVIHEGKQPQALQELADPKDKNTYGNSFKCIPSNIAYKPPKPVKSSVQGVQTAFVTGPQGEEIHVDEYGRIKVQFHWDREGENNERSSCWLRVAQPWAGSGWGSMFIPRIGQEVVVSFIDGDPDRPVVTGALYNGRTRLPYSLPAEKTKSTIKTRSTKGGGGFNEIRFEDKKDAEEIYIHGQKDANIEIINDKAQHIGHDETLDVDNDRTKTVANDQKESIGNNNDIEVEKNHTESIGENSRITVGKNAEKSIGENSTIDIGKNRKEAIGEDSQRYVKNSETVEIGQDHTKNIGNNNTVNISGKSDKSIKGQSTYSVGSNYSIDVTRDLKAQVGNKVSVTSDGSDIILQTAGASITISANGDITLSGANININGSGDINMNGSAVNQN